MEFRTFAIPLTRSVYSHLTTGDAVRQIFLDITYFENDDENPLYDIQESTYRGYLQEGRGISKIAGKILHNLDRESFAAVMDDLPTSTIDLLLDKYHDLIPKLESENFGSTLAEELSRILLESQNRRGSSVEAVQTKLKNKPSIASAELFYETGGNCPSCGKPISSDGPGRRYREIGITPLCAKQDYRIKRKYEAVVPQLPALGSPEDRILLFLDCANDYLADPTPAQCKALVDAKHNMRSHQKIVFDISNLELERNLPLLLAQLGQIRDFKELETLSMNALQVEKKIAPSNQLLIMKIESMVVRSYHFIREQLQILEAQNDVDFDVLAMQVRMCYLKLKKAGLSQEDIFNRICEWIMGKTGTNNRLECEVVAAFFVQNCEVFDEIA